MIKRDDWLRLRPVLEPALTLTPDQVQAYLDRVCAGDTELRRTAETLIRAVDQAGNALTFLETPAAELAAPLLLRERQAAVAAGDLGPGTPIGGYIIDRLLGSGGMGMVYLAHDHRLERKVAVKLLPQWLPASDAANRRVIQEAQAASALDHPNIQAIYEVGETADGRMYIAMAHYEGETLEQRIARGPLELPIAVDVARQIAAGLTAAHARSLVHRDIKPSNVIITADGVVKILDFGAAKLASNPLAPDGLAQGTIAYMSPEQTRTGPVDGRADVWALGVVLYEMLTGQRPFRGEGPDALFRAIRHEEPEPIEQRRPDVPESLARLVRRCLEKEPARRYASADEVRRDLEDLEDRPAGRWTARRVGVLAAAAMVAVALATPLLLRTAARRPIVMADAVTMAVIPPVSIGGDSALTRLGHELAVTLSANLDGIGGIRTLPATTILAHTGAGPPSMADGARLAAQFGASSFLYGTLVGSGGIARLDLELIESVNMAALAHVSVAAPLDDISALTDSATIELLRRVWRRGAPPVPDLSAVTTRSVTALRAYLEGELAFVQSKYDVAVSAFERSFAADSTFALAYWRSLYPRIYEGSQPDSTIVADIVAHRDRLPNAEALMVDAYVAPTLSEKLDILREVTTRYPDYWPGWYGYADRLVHDGPYLGSTYADARAALERVVELNPDFASGWVHLHWITSLQRDTIGVDRTVRHLDRLAIASGWVNPENMTLAYAFQEMLRADGELSEELAARLDSVALRPNAAANRAILLFVYGFPGGQLRQIDAVLRTNPPREIAAAQWRGRAFTWAGRGAWDSAFVAMEQWVRLSNEPRSALHAYGLGVLGVVTGAIEPTPARRWRPDSHPPEAERAEWLTERAWLDGVLAHAAADTSGITRALRELSASSAHHADLLVPSLRALVEDAKGHRADAARALLALELTASERGHHQRAAQHHPYLAAVHRPLAARWLLETGDTAQAFRLLPWHESILADGGRSTGRAAANRVVEPVALFERARIEEAWGWGDRAAEHYRELLERYDRPPARHATMVEVSRAALRRLAVNSTW